jgi:hypothetical protein
MKKNIFILALLAVAFFSCKKYVQQQEENEVINIITNGAWEVQQYLQDTTDITSSFSGYNFQFRTDGTVTGAKGSISITGTWAADVNNRTITSNFPPGSGILNDLDGVWTITDSGVDYVVANRKTGTVTDYLKLIKG